MKKSTLGNSWRPLTLEAKFTLGQKFALSKRFIPSPLFTLGPKFTHNLIKLLCTVLRNIKINRMLTNRLKCLA